MGIVLPPSIVIIVQADDLGVDDLHFNGNSLAYTPNFDKLAAKSLVASDFTVNAVCAPSRATLLTGRHFLRTGVSHVHGGKDFLHLDEKTIGDAFQRAGWKTGVWGKWHLGTEPGYQPWERGFNEAYSASLYHHRHSSGLLNGNYLYKEGWADEIMVEYAMDFIDRHAGEPLFLYLPSMSPHTPLDAPDRWVDFHRMNGSPEMLALLNGMVSMLDEEVGRLIDYLKTKDLWDNTLFVVTSDNGPAINLETLTDQERDLRKVSNRRGWKGDLWENGVRAPLVMHWPTRLKKRTFTTPLDQVDLLPTLLEWCQVDWPQTFPKLDGKSRAKLLEQRTHTDTQAVTPAPDPIFNYVHPGWITTDRPWTSVGIENEYRPVSSGKAGELPALEQPLSVREGRFKLLLNPHEPEKNKAPDWVLVDLDKDPGELMDVSREQPAVFEILKKSLLTWFDGVKHEPHVFSSPKIVVEPANKREFSANLINGLTGGVENTTMDVRGWSDQLSEVSYDLEIKQTGKMEVALQWTGEVPVGLGFQVRLAGECAISQTDGSHKTLMGALTFSEGRHKLLISRHGERLADKPLILRWVKLIPG